MRRWVFTFQKSVALVLSVLIKSSNNNASSNEESSYYFNKYEGAALSSHPSTIFTSKISPTSSEVRIHNSSGSSDFRNAGVNGHNNNVNMSSSYSDNNGSNVDLYGNNSAAAGFYRQDSIGPLVNFQYSNQHSLYNKPPILHSSSIPINVGSNNSIHVKNSLQSVNIPRNYSIPVSSQSNSVSNSFSQPSTLLMGKSPFEPILEINRNGSRLRTTSVELNVNFSKSVNEVKLAGSYVEPSSTKSVLESAMQRLSLSDSCNDQILTNDSLSDRNSFDSITSDSKGG